MGWWMTEADLLIGDTPLDEAEELLIKIVDAYLEEQGRKPTIDELLECIRAVLNVAPEAYISAPENVDIVELKAKTKVLPKRRKLVPGAIFSVPLKDGFYAFGRMTPQFLTADIYKVKSKKRLDVRTLIKYPTYRYTPMIAVDDGIRTGGWVIYDKLDYPFEGFEPTVYRMGAKICCDYKVRDDGFIGYTDSRVAKSEEYEKIPSMAISNLAMSVYEIERDLADAPII